MKRLAVILSALITVMSVVDAVNSCSKDKQRLKAKTFNDWLKRIDRKQDSIIAYRYNSTDSIRWMVEHKKRFDQSLDSAIQYYRDNYTSDEKRHKVYLAILYDYKKLSYLYSDWIKSSRINEKPAMKENDYQGISLFEFQSRQTGILMQMSSHRIDVIMID